MHKAESILNNMPAFFTLNQLAYRLGKNIASPKDNSTLRTTLKRWRERKLVKNAGPKVPVYYNLAKDPEAQKKNLERVLLHLYPSAVLVGSSALNENSATTQIPHRITFAVNRNYGTQAIRSIPDIFGAKGVIRTQAWFDKVRPHIIPGHGEFRTLDAEMALADAYTYRDTWVPDPDDLEIEAIDYERLITCFEAMETRVPEALNEALEDQLPSLSF